MALPFSKETKDIVVAKLQELLEQPIGSDLFIIDSANRKQKVSGICAIIHMLLWHGSITNRSEEPTVWYFIANLLRLAKEKNIIPESTYITYVDDTKKMTNARKDFIRFLLTTIEELDK